jgi:hypothetical protein
MAERTRLKEDIVKDALKRLAWPPLYGHLVKTGLDAPVFDELLGHVRRSNDLILKRPDTKKDGRRRAFLNALAEHVSTQAGTPAADELRATIATLETVERGYQEILRARDATAAAAMLPENRAAAVLARAAQICHELQQKIDSEMRSRSEAPLHSFRINIGADVPACPDSLLAHLTEACTITLVMEAYLNRWFGEDGIVVLPDMPESVEAELSGIDEIMALAMAWRRWERAEQRCRFLGGVLSAASDGGLPPWGPPDATAALRCGGPGEAETLDFVANARLHDRLGQTFVEMSWQTNMLAKGRGISESVALPPLAFVSGEEVHAGVTLSETLGYAIVDDDETPGGLRLVEWLRGYAALQCLVRERYASGRFSGLVTTIAHEDLVAILQRVGLGNGRAEAFISHASLNRSSRDLFDQPLIRMRNGSLLVFGPAILTAYPARVTLSAIGNLGVQLGRKGKAFERAVHGFFAERNLPAHAFKMTRDGEEYEFDAIVPWGDYVFLFECKNGTLSGNNIVPAYYFALEQRSAVSQVGRLADALRSHPDVLLERTGIDLTGKTVVPCVLNSLPFSVPGAVDGVYVTDMSALTRFFSERYLHVISPHRPTAGATVLHRTALKSFWKGDEPAPEDLLRQFEEPFQLALLSAHIETCVIRFPLGEGTVVECEEFVRKEFSVDSVAEFCGADAGWVRKEMKTVAGLVQKAKMRSDKKKARRDEKSVRELDRAWRARQDRSR